MRAAEALHGTREPLCLLLISGVVRRVAKGTKILVNPQVFFLSENLGLQLPHWREFWCNNEILSLLLQTSEAGPESGTFIFKGLF